MHDEAGLARGAGVLPAELVRAPQRLAILRCAQQRRLDAQACPQGWALDEHDLHGALLLTSASYSTLTAFVKALRFRAARAFLRFLRTATFLRSLRASPPSRPSSTAWGFFIAREFTLSA